jgi:hypothetical protein
MPLPVPDYRQPLTDFERRAGVVEPEPFPGDDSATVLRQIVGGGAGERWLAEGATDAVETLVTEHLRAGWMDRGDIERTGPFSLRVMHASYDGMSHAISYTDIDSGGTQIMTLSKGTTYAQVVDLILAVAGQVA